MCELVGDGKYGYVFFWFLKIVLDEWFSFWNVNCYLKGKIYIYYIVCNCLFFIMLFIFFVLFFLIDWSWSYIESMNFLDLYWLILDFKVDFSFYGNFYFNGYWLFFLCDVLIDKNNNLYILIYIYGFIK